MLRWCLRATSSSYLMGRIILSSTFGWHNWTAESITRSKRYATSQVLKALTDIFGHACKFSPRSMVTSVSDSISGEFDSYPERDEFVQAFDDYPKGQ